MKIVRNCTDTLVTPPMKLLKDITIGTIFKYCMHSEGPYLRLSGSCIVNLATNTVATFTSDGIFSNYLELPNARLVLE